MLSWWSAFSVMDAGGETDENLNSKKKKKK